MAGRQDDRGSTKEYTYMYMDFHVVHVSLVHPLFFYPHVCYLFRSAVLRFSMLRSLAFSVSLLTRVIFFTPTTIAKWHFMYDCDNMWHCLD